MRNIFVERWIVLLYILVIGGNSDNQSAFPFSNTGFLNELRIVPITRSANERALSVKRE